MTTFRTAFVYEKRRKKGVALRSEAYVCAKTDVGARELIADWCFKNAAKLLHIETLEPVFAPFIKILSSSICPN
jgi:hypothetical protein